MAARTAREQLPGDQTPCACGHTDYTTVWQGSYTRNGASKLEPYWFRLLRCRRCSLVRTDPVPDPGVYTAHDFDECGFPLERPWLGEAAEGLLADLRANGYKDGKVLDIGCNTGELVNAFHSMGVRAAGFDIDRAAVEYGIAQGRPLAVVNLEAEPARETYAAAVCIHTLEHTLDPTELLRNLAQSLEPGAPIHVAVPNFGGLAPRIMRENWGYLVPMLHVWQFTPRTLRSTVERAGAFRLVSSAQRSTLEPSAERDIAKRLVLALAGKLNRSDEIRAVFRRI